MDRAMDRASKTSGTLHLHPGMGTWDTAGRVAAPSDPTGRGGCQKDAPKDALSRGGWGWAPWVQPRWGHGGKKAGLGLD